LSKSKLQPRSLVKKTRNMVLSILAGLLIITVAGMIWSYSSLEIATEERTIYAHWQEVSLDYRVQLVPNDLFLDRVLEPGRAYITSLTEFITTVFEYRFAGEREAELSGQYSVKAVLSAHTGRGEESYLVWERDYELLPVSYFRNSEGEVSLRETVTIPLADYLEYVELVKEETGFTPGELKLTVYYDVDTIVEVDDQVAEEKFSPALTVYMGGNTFTIEGNTREEQSGGITKAETVYRAHIQIARTVFSIIAGLLLVSLVGFYLLTRPIEAVIKPGELEVATILKKHGERIVQTSGGLSEIPGDAFTVASIEELIKVADEFNRPILYRRVEDVSEIKHYFLVSTPEHYFAYGVSDSQSDFEEF
jgi:hypothetical protein